MFDFSKTATAPTRPRGYNRRINLQKHGFWSGCILAGLTAAPDVTVSRQVLAQPDLDKYAPEPGQYAMGLGAAFTVADAPRPFSALPGSAAPFDT